MAGPKSPDHRALGAALRARRNRLGWTLEELADRVQPEPMNPRYISACERGEVNISFSNLLRLVRALELSLSDLAREYERAR